MELRHFTPEVDTRMLQQTFIEAQYFAENADNSGSAEKGRVPSDLNFSSSAVSSARPENNSGEQLGSLPNFRSEELSSGIVSLPRSSSSASPKDLQTNEPAGNLAGSKLNTKHEREEEDWEREAREARREARRKPLWERLTSRLGAKTETEMRRANRSNSPPTSMTDTIAAELGDENRKSNSPPTNMTGAIPAEFGDEDKTPRGTTSQRSCRRESIEDFDSALRHQREEEERQEKEREKRLQRRMGNSPGNESDTTKSSNRLRTSRINRDDYIEPLGESAPRPVPQTPPPFRGGVHSSYPTYQYPTIDQEEILEREGQCECAECQNSYIEPLGEEVPRPPPISPTTPSFQYAQYLYTSYSAAPHFEVDLDEIVRERQRESAERR